MKINVLGTQYDYQEDDLNNPELAENDGMCRTYEKEIIVRKSEYMGGLTPETKEIRKKHVIRHELIHAVAAEAGVKYGNDEDLVDWIAHMMPIVSKLEQEIERETNKWDSSVESEGGLE